MTTEFRWFLMFALVAAVAAGLHSIPGTLFAALFAIYFAMLAAKRHTNV